MSHTSPQYESPKAGCGDRAQGVVFLGLNRVQLASNDNTNRIFVAYKGQLQIKNTQRSSMLLGSHSELQRQNSTCQFDMPVRHVSS